MLAAGLYLATLQADTFSDGLHLAQLAAESPEPYYHVLYLPVAWAFHAAFGGLLGGDAVASLQLLSAVATAGALALLARTLVRDGLEPATAALWLVVAAMAPAVWFFATTAEVHGLQLLAVTGAILLAERAREAAPTGAIVRLAVACVLAIASHVTAVLVVPGLVVLAFRREPGRGVGARALLGAAVGAILLLGAAELAARGSESERSALRPLNVLWIYTNDFLIRGLETRGLFGAGEMLENLAEEVLLPAGTLLAALLALAVREQRRVALALVASAPAYLLVFPQTGIPEEGGYTLTLFPLLALLGGRALVGWRLAPSAALPVFALLVAPQVALARATFERHREEPEARAWVAELPADLPPTALVWTTSLTRMNALRDLHGVPGGRPLEYEFRMVPRHHWPVGIQAQFETATEAFRAGRRVFLDAALLDASRAEPVRRFVAELRGKQVDLVPVGAPDADALLHEVTLRVP